MHRLFSLFRLAPFVAAIAIGVASSAFANADPSTTPTTSSQTAYYPNCRAACAAGVAPLHRGDPGYRAGLDRDDDGIACEWCP